MKFFQNQKNRQKIQKILEENFLEYFIYNIFKKFNETPNKQKKGREGALG